MAASLVLLLLGVLALSRAEVQLYISPEGDDSWNGRSPTREQGGVGPYATLHKARDSAKLLKDQAVIVNVEEGAYHLNATLYLTSQDSRSANAPLTFRSYTNTPGPFSPPVISGGLVLKTWKKLPSGLIEIDVPESLSLDISQFFVNGERQSVARKPNTGYLYWESPIQPCRFEDVELIEDPSAYWRRRASRSGCPEVDKAGFVFKEGDISKNWTNTENIQILLFHAWTATWHHIQSVNFANNTLFFKEKSSTPVGQFSEPSGHRYIVENVLEELDSAGEWFFDKSKRTILYKPPSSLDLSSVEFVTPSMSTIVSAQNVSHISFQGLSFQFSGEGSDDRQAYHTAWAAVQVQNCNGVEFDGCEFTHTGASGLIIMGESTHIFVNSCR